jgi:prepilin-type N-terminal cleavage/methylation domain-containing protein
MKKKRVHTSSVLKESGHPQNRGFTLLETLIGMFIFLTFVMMTNAYVASYIQTAASVKQLSRATTVGNDMIEKIRNSAYDKIENGKDTVENTYIRTWVLDPANTDSNKKCINLAVQWPRATKKHSLHLSTIIAK